MICVQPLFLLHQVITVGVVVIVGAVCNAVSFIGGVVMRFFTLRAKEYKLVAFSFAFINGYIVIHLRTPYIPLHLGP
jgi:hypothetical protein